MWGSMRRLSFASQDKTIGKRVWQLQSAVSVATHIRLPASPSESLGLEGRFCYIQVRSFCSSPRDGTERSLQVFFYRRLEFLLHLDVQDVHGNVHGVALSNAFRRRSKKVRCYALDASDFGTDPGSVTCAAFKCLWFWKETRTMLG